MFGLLILSAIIALLALALPCSSANRDYLKEHACKRWQEVGYECVGYEGYNYGSLVHGAAVWHTLKRKEAPGIIYTGSTRLWGDEIHIYGPKAIDAIKGE